MIRPLLALAALALLIGCFGADYVARPDPGFSVTTLAAARAAAADWMANVPVKITFADGPCPEQRRLGMICMHPVDSIPPNPLEPGVMTGYTVFTEMWLVEPALVKQTPAMAQRLIAHEMGHAMGLLHTGPGTLMYPYSDLGSLTVTPTDIAQWRAVRAVEAGAP
jgi:hypothetical protein